MFDKRLSGLGEVQWLYFLCPGLASFVSKIDFGYTHTHAHTHNMPSEENKTLRLSLTTKPVSGLHGAGSEQIMERTTSVPMARSHT